VHETSTCPFSLRNALKNRPKDVTDISLWINSLFKVYGSSTIVYCLLPLKHWGRGFESYSRHECLFAFTLCLCCSVQVAALRRADHPSKESYGLSMRLRNWSETTTFHRWIIQSRECGNGVQSELIFVMSKKTALFRVTWNPTPTLRAKILSRVYGFMTNSNGFWIGSLDLFTASSTITRNHNQLQYLTLNLQPNPASLTAEDSLHSRSRSKSDSFSFSLILQLSILSLSLI
jgi:hypothetical protein